MESVAPDKRNMISFQKLRRMVGRRGLVGLKAREIIAFQIKHRGKKSVDIFPSTSSSSTSSTATCNSTSTAFLSVPQLPRSLAKPNILIQLGIITKCRLDSGYLFKLDNSRIVYEFQADIHTIHSLVIIGH